MKQDPNMEQQIVQFVNLQKQKKKSKNRFKVWLKHFVNETIEIRLGLISICFRLVVKWLSSIDYRLK